MECHYKITKLINEYKRIIKRHLPSRQYTETKKMLKIRRNDLRDTPHRELYLKAKAVLTNVEALIESKNNTPRMFCGLRSFADHMRETLCHHVLNEHDTIFHAPQKASKAVIETIQMISMGPLERHIQKIHENVHIAKKYGTSDQISLLAKALNQPGFETSVLQPLIHELS